MVTLRCELYIHIMLYSWHNVGTTLAQPNIKNKKITNRKFI